MKFYARTRRMPTVIIVSLIDIFAILLIFVIVTTTFKREQPAISIKLPESTTATESVEVSTPTLLTIAANRKVFLDGREVAVPQLKTELKKLPAGRGLAVNADTDAPFGVIIAVLDALKEAGLKDVPAFTEVTK